MTSQVASLCKQEESERLYAYIYSNQAFQAFHGDLINKEPQPLEKLLNKVLLRQEKNQMYAYVCELFLKVRFFNRIKFLNVKLRENESAEKIHRCKQQMQHLY